MRIRILPYKQGSKGAKALSDALGGRVLKLEGSSFKPKAGDLIINWGYTQKSVTDLYGPVEDVRNHAVAIKTASNKLSFFNLMNAECSDVIPKFWTTSDAIPDDLFPIVCRTVLAGHSGEGIVIADTRPELVSAPLYVQYVKKKEEYRVHVGKKLDGSLHTIAVQRKARRSETPDEAVNWRIRNVSGGFIFQRNGFTCPDQVLDAAHKALRTTQLDFGAVDVIWNEQQGKPYVLEINTAPGLEGTTVQDYAAFFGGSTVPI